MAEILSLSPVVAVLTLDAPAAAVEVARALSRGGLRVLEVTLRTEQAWEALRAIRKALPEVVLGVGTVIDATALKQAENEGFDFAVSPGCTPRLLESAQAARIPFLPGVTTPSEAMSAAAMGFFCQKFFPAEAAGGEALLRAIYGPLPHLRFCANGGITPTSAKTYLALPNVMSVGASYVAPKEALEAGDWAALTALAQEASSLPRGDT